MAGGRRNPIHKIQKLFGSKHSLDVKDTDAPSDAEQNVTSIPPVEVARQEPPLMPQTVETGESVETATPLVANEEEAQQATASETPAQGLGTPRATDTDTEQAQPAAPEPGSAPEPSPAQQLTENEQAAIKVQAIARGSSDRKALAEQQAAATKMQAATRGHQAHLAAVHGESQATEATAAEPLATTEALPVAEKKSTGSVTIEASDGNVTIELLPKSEALMPAVETAVGTFYSCGRPTTRTRVEVAVPVGVTLMVSKTETPDAIVTNAEEAEVTVAEAVATEASAAEGVISEVDQLQKVQDEEMKAKFQEIKAATKSNWLWKCAGAAAAAATAVVAPPAAPVAIAFIAALATYSPKENGLDAPSTTSEGDAPPTTSEGDAPTTTDEGDAPTTTDEGDASPTTPATVLAI